MSILLFLTKGTAMKFALQNKKFPANMSPYMTYLESLDFADTSKSFLTDRCMETNKS